MDCTQFVGQYGILKKQIECLIIPKKIPNKRYTLEFKKKRIETTLEEKMIYCDAMVWLGVDCDKRVKD